MKPYYDEGGITIYHGDCRDVLPQLDLDAALLLTDPPYGISTADITRNHGHTLRQQFFTSDDPDLAIQIVASIDSLLAADAGAFVFCGHRQFGGIEAALAAQGFATGHFSWTKTNPAPSVRKGTWVNACELAVWGTRGDGFCWRDQRQAKNAIVAPAVVNGHREKNGHPTQKPLLVVLPPLRQYSEPGGLVLDPFAGSGTTLHAAKLEGRRAVGIEIEERYCEIAVQRLGQEVMDLEAA